MSSDDSESESEDCRFFHWNNWSAPDDVKTFCEHNQQKGNNSKNYMVSCKEPTAPPSVALMEDKTDRFKSWIPPTDLVFKNRTYRKGNIKILSDNESKTTAINCEPNSAELSTYSSQLLPDMSSQYCPDLQLSKWNSDWNERSELHDVTNFNDGDMIWDVIDPGIFGNYYVGFIIPLSIKWCLWNNNNLDHFAMSKVFFLFLEVMKLWINKYGNICGKAEGKISKQGSSEKAFLLINTPENLRKLLNIKNLEW